MISKTLILLPFAYVMGSVPWGVILTRLFGYADIRKAGSGNIGAYNVYRVAGKKLGVLTLVGDLLKGAVPVMMAASWIGFSGWTGEMAVCLIALAAFAGHLYSVFLGLNGGKGVATAAGCLLILSPFVFLICFLVYVLLLCITGYSSAGSLAAAAVLPGAIWIATHSVPMTGCTLVMALFIFARHADNVKRLLSGTEHSSMRS
jgi:glycerol-3-phosphate acyltransferase PlsY